MSSDCEKKVGVVLGKCLSYNVNSLLFWFILLRDKCIHEYFFSFGHQGA